MNGCHTAETSGGGDWPGQAGLGDTEVTSILTCTPRTGASNSNTALYWAQVVGVRPPDTTGDQISESESQAGSLGGKEQVSGETRAMALSSGVSDALTGICRGAAGSARGTGSPPPPSPRRASPPR